MYARALAATQGARTVVRTLDAGADKPLAFAAQEDEENPALGVRGYRLVRTLPELLSMSAPALPAVRHALRHHTLARCRAIAEAALSAPAAAQARRAALALADAEVAVLLGLGVSESGRGGLRRP